MLFLIPVGAYLAGAIVAHSRKKADVALLQKQVNGFSPAPTVGEQVGALIPPLLWPLGFIQTTSFKPSTFKIGTIQEPNLSIK